MDEIQIENETLPLKTCATCAYWTETDAETGLGACTYPACLGHRIAAQHRQASDGCEHWRKKEK